MPGHSRSKNGVALLAYVPGIHVFLSLEALKDVDGRDKPGHDVNLNSDRFCQQRQLPRARLLCAEVRERGRIVAGEAMVGELRPRRVATRQAHGAIDAIDRQEGQRVGADKFAHALEVVGRGQQFVALGCVDPVLVGMSNRR